MARNYGRFTTTIWRDPDFTRLERAQQAVYFMLCTQPEVTAAGTLPVTLRRWANTAAGETVETLRDQLKALEGAGHIIVDEDTEELLIVKFIKFDQGWYNEKRWPLVAAALRSTASIHIRDKAVDEIVRLTQSATRPDGVKPESWNAALDRARHGVSAFDRSGYVSKRGTEPTPQSSNPRGEPSPPMADDPRSKFCPEHQPDGTDQDCGKCARRRESNDAKARAALEAEVETRRAARAAIADCDECDEKGVRLHPRSKLPLGRCDHSPIEVSA